MTDDLWGVGGEPVDEMLAELEAAGVDPNIRRVEIRPGETRPLEGYHLPADEGRAREIADLHGAGLMHVLVVDRGSGYETVDGVHRVEAARIMGLGTIPALEVDEATFETLFRDYGGAAMHRLAHDLAGTRFDP